jgi:hypothetical protein
MHLDFRRLFFVVGVLWVLIMWLLFSVYGALRFWERHVQGWVYGGTLHEIIAIGVVVLSIFWIFFIIKTIKDEADEYHEPSRVVTDDN